MIVILGPTATGKTKLAAEVAYKINGEIISADSRQVYRDMTVGTGKDYDDYIVEGIKIPYHLIDIVEPGHEYNIFEYKRDFKEAYNKVLSLNKKVILCGGSGLYIESVISPYRLDDIPHNEVLRKEFDSKSESELIQMLSEMKNLHNKTDIVNRDRLYRALEIAFWHRENPPDDADFIMPEVIFGLRGDRDLIRSKITDRLIQRLENENMIEEVEKLLDMGVDSERLKIYGLEYKFITMHILGEIPYNTMVSRLETAIHRFSKRQMTWYRRMERKGFKINWIDIEMPRQEKINYILDIIDNPEIN